jgi:hypothetical protein
VNAVAHAFYAVVDVQLAVDARFAAVLQPPSSLWHRGMAGSSLHASGGAMAKRERSVDREAARRWRDGLLKKAVQRDDGKDDGKHGKGDDGNDDGKDGKSQSADVANDQPHNQAQQQAHAHEQAGDHDPHDQAQTVAKHTLQDDLGGERPWHPRGYTVMDESDIVRARANVRAALAACVPDIEAALARVSTLTVGLEETAAFVDASRESQRPQTDVHATESDLQAMQRASLVRSLTDDLEIF